MHSKETVSDRARVSARQKVVFRFVALSLAAAQARARGAMKAYTFRVFNKAVRRARASRRARGRAPHGRDVDDDRRETSPRSETHAFPLLRPSQGVCLFNHA